MGFTVGCPGCRAVNRGLPAVNHSEACRNRIEQHMRDNADPQFLAAENRLGRGELVSQQASSTRVEVSASSGQGGVQTGDDDM